MDYVLEINLMLFYCLKTTTRYLILNIIIKKKQLYSVKISIYHNNKNKYLTCNKVHVKCRGWRGEGGGLPRSYYFID